MDAVTTLPRIWSVLVVDDSDKAALLYIFMTVHHDHEVHPGDFSASLLTSYRDFELSTWSKEGVESCLETHNR